MATSSKTSSELNNQMIVLNSESTSSNNELQLSPISVHEDYLKKWNESSRDFVCLTKNGEILHPTLYRIGGLGHPNLKKDKYFMLLKHVEALYDFKFIKGSYPKKTNSELELRRKHLESRWCIIDSNGIEKVEFKRFESPYLVKDSCIYTISGNYFNIETGEKYCSSHSMMESNEFLFLSNDYDKDQSKRGVMKIHKQSGTFVLFPKK